MSLFCLKELEQSQMGLTTDELHSRIANAGHEAPVQRTLQREFLEFEKRGITISTSRKRHRITQKQENLHGFMTFMRAMSLDPVYSRHFFGDLDARRGADYFAGRADVIKLFYEIFDAIINHRLLTFDYTPQSDITLLRMKLRSKFQHTDAKVIPVRLLPRFLVTSGNSFLVLGEYYEKKTFYKNHFAKPKSRHYELRGIGKLAQAEVTKPLLDLNPLEIYRNSVQVWAGGKEYELELEEFWYDGGKPLRKKRKVNGEDEILSLAAASLGRIRIINPPEALKVRAHAIGLPQDLIFRFE